MNLNFILVFALSLTLSNCGVVQKPTSSVGKKDSRSVSTVGDSQGNLFSIDCLKQMGATQQAKATCKVYDVETMMQDASEDLDGSRGFYNQSPNYNYWSWYDPRFYYPYNNNSYQSSALFCQSVFGTQVQTASVQSLIQSCYSWFGWNYNQFYNQYYYPNNYNNQNNQIDCTPCLYNALYSSNSIYYPEQYNSCQVSYCYRTWYPQNQSWTYYNLY